MQEPNWQGPRILEKDELDKNDAQIKEKWLQPKRKSTDTDSRYERMKGYERMRKTEAEGGRPINHPEWMGRRKRRIQKLTG